MGIGRPLSLPIMAWAGATVESTRRDPLGDLLRLHPGAAERSRDDREQHRPGNVVEGCRHVAEPLIHDEEGRQRLDAKRDLDEITMPKQVGEGDDVAVAGEL